MSRDFLLRVNTTRREYPRDATVPQEEVAAHRAPTAAGVPPTAP